MIRLADIHPHPGDTGAQAAQVRHNLLAYVTATLGITGPYPGPTEWATATIPADRLVDLRAAVEHEGARGEYRSVSLPGGRQNRWHQKYPARVVNETLALIDRHAPEDSE